MLAWWVVYGVYKALRLSHWATQAPQQMFARDDTKVVGNYLEASLATSQAGDWVLTNPHPSQNSLPLKEQGRKRAGVNGKLWRA